MNPLISVLVFFLHLYKLFISETSLIFYSVPFPEKNTLCIIDILQIVWKWVEKFHELFLYYADSQERNILIGSENKKCIAIKLSWLYISNLLFIL